MAFMRLVACVNYLMPAESAGQAKAFTTDVANEGASTGMAWHFQMDR